MRAIQVTEPGGPEALVWTEVDDPVADAGTVVVELEASGVNYIDTYHRSGLYPMPLPFISGVEGAGTVAEVGDGVEDLVVGDRVAWTSHTGS